MASVEERYQEWKKKKKSQDGDSVEARYQQWAAQNGKQIDIAGAITNRVNAYLKKHNSYLSDYNKRYSGRTGTYADSYVSDSADWLSKAISGEKELYAEAESIRSLLDDYSDYLDSSAAWELRNAINAACAQQAKIVHYSTDDNRFWSQYTEEDYRKEADEYKAYLAQQKEYEDKLNMDTEAANKEIGGLENDLDDYYFLNDWYKAYLTSPEILDQATLGTNLARYNELSGKYGSSDQLEALIQDKNEYLKAAEQVQAEAALAAREEGYQKKYGGMSFEALQPVITGMEDGEEKDWLSDYAHSVMTDDDYEAQINETNKRITTLENAIKLQKSYILMGKKGIGDLTDLQSELDAAKKNTLELNEREKLQIS